MTVRAVWKFPVPLLAGEATHRMPAGAQVVHVAGQDGTPTVWAVVDPGSFMTEARTFRVVGTGQEIPGDAAYVGTAHCGPYVWHVWEIR